MILDDRLLQDRRLRCQSVSVSASLIQMPDEDRDGTGSLSVDETEVGERGRGT